MTAPPWRSVLDVRQLMERHDLDDLAAFDRLRRQARSSARKLADMAREIIGDHPR